MLKRLILPLLVLCFSVSAHAQTIDINVNDNTAEVMVRAIITEEVYGYYEFNGRFLYSSDSRADNKLGSAGVDAFGEMDTVPGLELGVGAKLYGVRVEHNDVLCLGLGAQFRYTAPTLSGFVFSGTVYYAPKVLSFLDGERLVETDIRVGYQIISNATVYIGYRNIRTHIEDSGKPLIGEGVHGGLEFRF